MKLYLIITVKKLSFQCAFSHKPESPRTLTILKGKSSTCFEPFRQRQIPPPSDVHVSGLAFVHSTRGKGTSTNDRIWPGIIAAYHNELVIRYYCKRLVLFSNSITVIGA